MSSHGPSPRACVCGGAAAVVAICSARAVGKTAYNRISAHSHAFRLEPIVAAFVQRLRDLGWIEGRNVAIEFR